MSRRALGHGIAAALLAGEWRPPAMADRVMAALDPPPPYVTVLVDAVLDAYHRPPLDRPRELGAYVAIVLDELDPLPDPDADDLDDLLLPEPTPRVVEWGRFHPEMAFARWPVPRIDTVGDLAAFLGLEVGALEWFADVRGLERVVNDERLRHYRYVRVARKSGPPRVIEAPKPRLKALQRRVLHELLDLIPVHGAAHGFVGGRSARTHALAHVGRRVVVRLDLEDFFAGVTAARVFGIFRAAGYPESVAHVLTGLCTNVVPAQESVPVHWRLSRRLATPHLPQGAPTSPALANLAAFALDRRLTGLAAAIGATYTRYADDLVLSSDRRLRTPVAAIGAIARAEGFRVNAAKTRVMGRGRRQTVTGVVVNAHPNVPRAEYDTLKATLHRAALDGPPADLDPTVLLGRIAWVESLNPTRGEKLRTAFATITWPPRDS
ncbi:reverse transcriptase family protein [Solirubrobacter ginsenosidimutans]|uniref:RNA-directed DNA polymerase n=1 Tax=Solirubrobacter ginsenosidimutans TaxID=490573 RepID=A0A9X3MVJ4_9ACTN|nr:reverse transcriptase family protein [Solirubrobacter ginsenosidimutans]MDA0163197.1 reverse transcriptase family protein [Solirubrobacter ginsenosidimutans]